MPTMSNPVSSVPVSNASQSKSLRSRLGFGGNNNKPSFFTQLNLKPSRRSFTVQPDGQSQDQTILFVNTSSGNDGSRSMSLHNSVRTSFNSLSKATALHSRIPQRKVVAPDSNHSAPHTANFNNRIQLDTPINPNDSGTSNQLPNLSNELSLLVNEPVPLDAASSRRSSQESVIHIGSFSDDLTEQQRRLPDTRVSLPTRASIDTNDSLFDDFGMNESFDLSKARTSLEAMKEEESNERWSQEIIVKDISLSNTDTSAVPFDISDSSLHHSRNGPVTSTPFVSRKASPSQIQPQPELSFDLEALDPDLIALLRPNSFQQESDVVAASAEKRPRPPRAGNLSALKVTSKPVTDCLAPEPISPQYDANTSITRRFSKTIMLPPSPSSPVRPGQPPRFQLSQQTPALSHAPKPTVAINRIPWLDSPESEAGQMSSGPSTVSSNLGTPSDFSKPPSPFVSLQPSVVEKQRRPEPFVVTKPTPNFNSRNHENGNIYTSPDSTLPPPVDSRANSRFTSKNIDVQVATRLPPNEMSDDIGRPRTNLRNQTLDILRSEGRPSSADPSHSFRPRGNSSAGFSHSNERSMFESRRYRKRSMSVDQTPDLSQPRRDSSENVRPRNTEYAYKPVSARDFTFDGRIPDNDNEEHNRYGYPEVGRDRTTSRLSPEWLGPRTVKAFAAAGLLEESRDNARYTSHGRSVSEFRTSTTLSNHARSSTDGFTSMESERDRDTFRYNSPNRLGDYRVSGMRSGTTTPNVSGFSRPLSRADSWSNSRQAPLFVRTISDLVSRRGSMEGRDSLGSSSYPRTNSGYSNTGGTRSESTGSGGRLSPTTTCSHITVQSQLQSLKDKYDSQTEALLAALADSQKTCRDLRAENGNLKGQVRELEERLVEAITTAKQKEKELARARRLYSNDRSSRVAAIGKPAINTFQPQSRPLSASNVTRSVSPPKVRRFSNSSSIFPTIPKTMAMLLAETPDESPASPPLGSGTSPPPSPTLVLPKLTPESNVIKKMDNRIASSPIPISHRRSTSGTSIATSANFSFKSGSPGSLKLKPEHEFLLGDLTQLSLVAGSGTDSEAEQ